MDKGVAGQWGVGRLMSRGTGEIGKRLLGIRKIDGRYARGIRRFLRRLLLKVEDRQWGCYRAWRYMK